MRTSRQLWYLSLGFIICGCNGEIRTRMWTPEDLQKALSSSDGVKGTIGYYNRGAIEISTLKQLVDEDGKFVSTDCIPVSMQKVVTITDYQHPYQIWYNYGLLEANKFGVQLSSSVFTAINSESTPDQGKTVENLANAASSLAKISAVPSPEPIKRPPITGPNCNGGPSFEGYAPLPKVL